MSVIVPCAAARPAELFPPRQRRLVPSRSTHRLTPMALALVFAGFCTPCLPAGDAPSAPRLDSARPAWPDRLGRSRTGIRPTEGSKRRLIKPTLSRRCTFSQHADAKGFDRRFRRETSHRATTPVPTDDLADWRTPIRSPAQHAFAVTLPGFFGSGLRSAEPLWIEQ